MISEQPPTRTIAIIGAGYSGTLTAVNILLNNPPKNLRLLLIEQHSRFGRGLAYRFDDDNFMLNVPAGNMSALSKEPAHFVNYCQLIDPSYNEKSFVSRRIYGQYLEDLLTKVMAENAESLEKRNIHVIGLNKDFGTGKFRIRVEGGSDIEADQVVLAIGHFPSTLPAFVPPDMHDLILSPWNLDGMDRVNKVDPIIVIGMGHTAIDAVFRLTNHDQARKVYMLSRRGLVPHSHRDVPKATLMTQYPSYIKDLPTTVLAYMRALRAEIRRREGTGGNWRDVIGELRPYTSEIWRKLPEVEKRRFTKKLVPYWDIHRHRLAPMAARRFAKLVECGQVEKIAGRVLKLAKTPNGVAIKILERGQTQVRELVAAVVVNCIGPNYDLNTITEPLVIDLKSAGMIRQDPLKLGILVDENYQLINNENYSTKDLFYIGPMLRAQNWEAIAIPELRHHTSKLSEILIDRPLEWHI